MAKRRGKAKARRRTNKSINLLNVAESLVLANVVTEGIFNAGLKDFIMGTRDGTYVAGRDGGSRLTLPEILGIGKNVAVGGNYGSPPEAGFENFTSTVVSNATNNAMTMIPSLILIPIGFTIVKKMTSKPRAQANRLLKNVGLKEVRV